MTSDRLIIAADADPQVAWLIVEPPGAAPRKEAIELPPGFHAEHVREALLAIGLARQSGEVLRLSGDVRCEVLCRLVEEMFNYFEAPGIARRRLLEIQSAVDAYCADAGWSVGELPLYAYAWLDVTVREDLADEARTAHGIWTQAAIQVDCQSCCRRRLEELLARRAASAPPDFGRLAGSIPTRPARPSRATGT